MHIYKGIAKQLLDIQIYAKQIYEPAGLHKLWHVLIS